ncbi:MTH1187 family thiamine-binding protein [Lamprobacter modestohalophilus]|uniref:MTH1187 family thiamine-binding protein n=1 Tax=Lamprobacter modestohalophilus TaxID=1064514 RepID=UPI002ADEBB64|nr:MTH1187 family thiamine-binding protein [Lamprobacter modestohalophilus]MEA1049299.1 MTH1187 family thiamine-binding protein [Lamprobacter modestohalophilus]
MSVLVDFSIFPVGEAEHLSPFVASVVDLIADSGHSYQLTAMGTLFETDALGDALSLIERAQALLAAAGCKRVYATVKLDIREGPTGRLAQKTASVEARLRR